MNKNDIIRLQEKRFNSTIDFAYHHIPNYHRKIRKHRIRSSDIESLKNVKRIPITTKDELATVPLTEWIPRHLDIENCYLSKTSGSTGIITVTAYNHHRRPLKQL
ncbi:MAG: hypothetical protein P1Q69_10880 [Candidatus Thorarchaeota archaeon]|nr:hypothetical protein [Candidatus Thorarchaeota archaeon]